MKITSAIILMSVSLCASLCCSGEHDYFSPQINISNNTIVQIENNETTFNVGESIVIETNILNAQAAENGQNILLTDYDYAEVGQSRYQHALVLYKETAFGTIAKIPLTQESITNIEGETLVENSAIIIRSIYDGTSYKNKFSIILPEAGTFYLAGNRFLIDDDGKFRITGGIYERAFIKITSTITNANTSGGYEFVVN